MPIWAQNLLVLLAVAASAAFIFRQAFIALQGRKSRLGGCGSCHGCSPSPAAGQGRQQIFPVELLKKKL